MPLRAVFFDVDDTLVDFETSSRRAFAAVLGGGVDDHAAFRALNYYERYLAGELDFQTMREQRMAEFLTRSGRDSDLPRAAELEAARFAALREHYTLFADVLPALAAVRARGLAVGLITNNEGAHQRHKIALLGLDRLVDAIVISGEVDVAKPDARIFALATGRLGVAPGEAMHVGDNLTADAQGARDAGLRAVWLNRLGPAGPESGAGPAGSESGAGPAGSESGAGPDGRSVEAIVEIATLDRLLALLG